MKRWVYLVIGALVGLVLALALQYAISPSMGSTAVLVQKILIDPDFFPFSMQLYMWIAFFAALGDIWWRLASSSRIDRMSAGGMDKVRTERSHLWTDANLTTAWHAIVDRDDRDLVADWCREVIRKFQIAGSVDQCTVTLRSKYESELDRIYHDYTLIRYINWLLPTLGFIGTVVGIAFAMGNLATVDILNMSENEFGRVFAQLGTAFYTTLLGLLLSVALVFLTQAAETLEERRVQRYFRFCEDEFLSKLHTRAAA
jgi:biopolymer transport protein ExbB/TolQ